MEDKEIQEHILETLKLLKGQVLEKLSEISTYLVEINHTLKELNSNR